MRKLLTSALGLAAFFAMAGIACAADAAAAPAAGRFMDAGALGMSYMAAAIGMAIAAAGCGIAQGLGLKAACEGTARNPEAGGKLMVTLILGLAFIESLAIYALVVNLILLFVNPLSAPLS
jgi:F-type H+-transporting ATPase subunit c